MSPVVIALGGAIALAGCGSGGPGKLHSGVVAEVGNVAISEAELNHWISLEATFAQKKSGVKVTKPLVIDPPSYSACVAGLQSAAASAPAAAKGKKTPKPSVPSASALKRECKSHYEQLEPHSLEHLIFVNWVLGEASHLGLKASASEIQQQMQTTKQSFEKQPGGYQKFLEESGTTAADLLRQVTFSQLEGKLSQKISKEVMTKANSQGVPHSKIAAYYKENLRKYEHPETRDIQVIITESLGAASKAKREIQSGKSFASVEKRVSRYPAEAGQIKQSGGMLPEVMRRKFETVKHSMPGASTPSDEKILEEAIFQAKEHVLTGPVKTSEAYFLLQVNKVKKEEPTETLAQEESSIKQTLTENRGARMFSNFNQELEKRWKAKTNCAKGFVILYCEQFVPHKEMSLAEQSKLHGRETEAMKTQQEHQVKLNSSAIVKPTILASENGAKPQFATRYTCYGANISPPFSWSDLPRATAEVLLLVEQLTDRGVRSKIWTVAGISPSAHGISAGSLPPGAIVGRNSAGKATWDGICPPKGTEYEYTVTIVPLRTKLGLKPGFDLRSLERKLRSDSLSSALLFGSYKHS